MPDSTNETGKIPEWMGNFPFPADKKRPALITRENEISTVYGDGPFRISPRIFASTDKILMSDWRVPPGGSFTPPDIHSGDELYYIAKGRATIVNPETGQVLEVPEGDAVFIPKGGWHVAFNFTDKDIVVVAIIEGKIWDESDMGSAVAYTKPYKYIKAG